VLVVILSRTLARRTQWARALHNEQRPFVHAENDLVLFAMALGSGLCEELFFRAFLGRTVGIALAAIAFGALHRVRGRARWGWMLTAAGLGVWFSLLFEMTGQLIGPIVAHVIINAANLRHLRDHRVAAKARKLGGLLAPSTTRDAA
jgi:membrane protease YdiL (CAAX protease family)